MPNLFAYVDPGSGSLLWQLLLAGGFGVYFWYRQSLRWLTGAIRVRLWGQRGAPSDTKPSDRA